MAEMPESDQRFDYDVVVIGGAIAGAATALLLRRRVPGVRVLVVEKREEFDWKVGESTVEVAAYFLSRVLRLGDHLYREQLPKQAFRYWFHNERVTRLREASEVGPTQQARIPSFQLDRAKLDEHVLATARAEGAEVWRPARMLAFELGGEAGNTVTIERGDGGDKSARSATTVRCRWVVDASGRAALLARRRGGVTPIESHPTAALWVRYRNLADLDGTAVAGTQDHTDPFVRGVVCSRRLATNHFTGFGYWIWVIPLRGGETSVGLVWDKRYVDPPGDTPLDKLTRFLEANPLTRELIAGAEAVEGDIRYFPHLPYFVDRFIGPGWTCVGDAGGFLDPFYSPGLDQMSWSVHMRVNLIASALQAGADPAAMQQEYDRHNDGYKRYFEYFYEAIYQDKYAVMGDYDTMTTAFLLDTALYYMVAVIPLYRWSHDRMGSPPFYEARGASAARRCIRFYNRRLGAIALRKRQLGTYGSRNDGLRPGLVGFSVRSSAWVMLAHGLVRWARAEAVNLWSHVVAPQPVGGPQPNCPPSRRASEPAMAPAHTAPSEG